MKKLKNVFGNDTRSPDLQRCNSSSSVASVSDMRRRASVESMAAEGGGTYDPDSGRNLQYVETMVSINCDIS